MKEKKKRLRRGVDWHAWVWEARDFYKNGDRELMHFAEADRPKDRKPTEKGRWVKVLFVVVP